MIREFKEKTIGVLMGGLSSEREVSLSSGNQVLTALKVLGYNATKIDPAQEPLLNNNFDIAFNVLHGEYGEDGTIQSLLDLHHIPYTGSGPKASIIAMNKLFTKHVLIKHQLPTPAFELLTSTDELNRPSMPYPVVLKPLNQGSSVGVFIVNDDVTFQQKARFILTTFGPCLIEEFIVGQEVTVGLIGDGLNTQVLPLLELRSKNQFYDYDAKYTKGMTDFILPAELDQNTTTQCQDIAKRLHCQLGCSGMSRVDMCVDSKRGPFILEINTIPGLTPTSDLPAQAAHINIDFNALVEEILKSALPRFKQQIK